MARKRVFTDEERKQRKKEYDIKYQNNRYKTDAVYREMKKGVTHNQYTKKLKSIDPIVV